MKKNTFFLLSILFVANFTACSDKSSLNTISDAFDSNDTTAIQDIQFSKQDVPDVNAEDMAVHKKDVSDTSEIKNPEDVREASDVHEVIGTDVEDVQADDNAPLPDDILPKPDTGCDPLTCESLNKECGTFDNGCGGTLNCGGCGAHQTCESGKCVDHPYCGNGKCDSGDGENCSTCALDCGCGTGQTCVDEACCTLKTCESLNKECGVFDNGCGGTVNCGGCAFHQACESGKCVDQPYCGNGKCEPGHGENCASCSKDCGCGTGQTCVDDACCTLKTCAGIDKECGVFDNGCNGTLDCGGCGSHQTCESGKCVDQPYCGDKICNNGETCSSCAKDCGSCCGNGKCETGYGENCSTCAKDCGCTSGQKCVNKVCVASYPPDGPNELIRDRHFSRGFIAINHKTGAPIMNMPSGLAQGDPIWELSLGYCNSKLYNQPRQTLADGSVKWEDIYGSLIIGTPGASEGDLTSDVEGYTEYGGVYYVPSAQQGWVYHLTQQQISYPGNYSTGSPPMSAIARLDFSAFAQLLKAEQNKKNGYNSKYHAAQYLIYFTVQNQNIKSPGFGDYLWFGITFYDDRYDIPAQVIMQDKGGTERLIYNLGAGPFISSGLKVGGPGKTFSGDLMPAMRDALTRAWANGFLTGSNVLSDYRIGGMNIGWEVSGLNNVSMRVKDLSLRYTKRPVKPVVFDFNTDGDREGWTLTNANEITQGPKDGVWIFSVPGAEPMLLSPELSIEAATHPILRVKMANDHGPIDKSYIKVYWDRFGDRGLREAWNRMAKVSNGGGTETVTIDMSKSPGWVGEIHQIRVDPVLGGNGNGVLIDEIAILPAQ